MHGRSPGLPDYLYVDLVNLNASLAFTSENVYPELFHASLHNDSPEAYAS